MPTPQGTVFNGFSETQATCFGSMFSVERVAPGRRADRGPESELESKIKKAPDE